MKDDYVDLSKGKAKKKSSKKNMKKYKNKPKPKKTNPNKNVKLHVETSVDRLYEIVRDKGIISLKDVSKKLRVEEDHVEEWAHILEEHKLVKMHYPPVGEPTIILKKFKNDIKGVVEKTPRKKIKFNKKIFIINVAILVIFLVAVVLLTVGRISLRITVSQLYLGTGVIIIIIVAIVGIIFRKRWKAWLRRFPKMKMKFPKKK